MPDSEQDRQKEWDAFRLARDMAAYGMVGVVASQLFNHEKLHQPIDGAPLRKQMDEYEAANKALEDFWKPQKEVPRV